MALQFYFDRTERLEYTTREERETYDLDFQHCFPLFDRHEIVWGMGYRATMDEIGNSEFFGLEPDERALSTYSAFVQDKVSIVRDCLSLTVGSKFEEHDYTGFEYQPTGKILWTPSKKHTFWASVTRAVRTPARFDHDIIFTPAIFQAGPTLMKLDYYGDKDFKSETVIAEELGYRHQASDDLSIDIAGFFNEYDNLATYESGVPFFSTSPVPHMVLPRTRDHLMKGETYGGECVVNWDVMEDWRLTGVYSYIRMQLHTDAASTNPTRDEEDEGRVPRNIFHLNSRIDLFEDVELDTSLFYVDNLPTPNISNYLRFDARLGWHITDGTELSLSVENLFDPQHPENISRQAFSATEVERSIFLKLTCRF